MKPLAVALLLVASLTLAGCTSAANSTPSPSGATLDPAALSESYQVKGGGQFVQGSRIMCDLEPLETILIEDQKSVDAFQGNTSVTSMTFDSGKVTYATIWPHDVVGTGITKGSGTYTVNADSLGRPVSITGHATVTWHDEATNTLSKKSESLSLTITKIARPAYC